MVACISEQNLKFPILVYLFLYKESIFKNNVIIAIFVEIRSYLNVNH